MMIYLIAGFLALFTSMFNRKEPTVQTLFDVRADHPTLRRPDRYNMTKNQMLDFVDQLNDLGYENITIVERERNV